MAMVTITSIITIAKYNKGQICIASVPVIKGQGKHEQDRALHCPNKISIATSHMPSSVIQDGAKVQEYTFPLPTTEGQWLSSAEQDRAEVKKYNFHCPHELVAKFSRCVENMSKDQPPVLGPFQ